MSKFKVGDSMSKFKVGDIVTFVDNDVERVGRVVDVSLTFLLPRYRVMVDRVGYQCSEGRLELVEPAPVCPSCGTDCHDGVGMMCSDPNLRAAPSPTFGPAAIEGSHADHQAMLLVNNVWKKFDELEQTHEPTPPACCEALPEISSDERLVQRFRASCRHYKVDPERYAEICDDDIVVATAVDGFYHELSCREVK